MSETKNGILSRREFLKETGRVAAASALAAGVIPYVHAAEDNTLRIALVGCGGRGTGAVEQAFAAPGGPLRLVAMADVFDNRLNDSYNALARGHAGSMDVPPERRFAGLDAYRKAMDCLRPGDLVILATPPAFRWPHFTYAIEKGLNVFMEKPISVDGPSTRRMLALGEESVKKGLKVGVGLMCRHCDARRALSDRLRAGEAGEVIALRAYRMHDQVGYFSSAPKPEGISHLLYQVQRFHSFLWSGGGAFSDFYIHNIDECCWMKGAWPAEASGIGGRHYRGNSVDQNFDTYTVEYTFPDGTKFFLEGRCIAGCANQFASYAHTSKGLVIISEGGHNGIGRIYNGHQKKRESLAWEYRDAKPSPYQLEWNRLIAAIRGNEAYNEVKRGAEASLATVMGRMACHTGQVITWDQAMNHEHEMAPDLDKLTADSPAPLQPDAEGRYPIPRPGQMAPPAGQPVPREY